MTSEAVVCRTVFLVAPDAEPHLELVRRHYPVHQRNLSMALAAVEASMDVH